MEDEAGKSLTARARKYFETSQSERAKEKPEIKFFMCKICKKDINCSSRSNMVPHLRLKHSEIYKSEIDIDSIKDHALITRLKLVQSCVELVTVNGKTFTTLSCSGFLKSHSDTLQKLNLAGCSLNLEDEHLYEIKEYIHNIAAKTRDKIKAEVRGRVLSLMIDGATRNNRSLLGISVQFVDNGTVKVIPIGVKELHESHKATYLCTVVKNTLADYGIRLRTILTVTSDNASNMIATTQALEIELNKAIVEDCQEEYDEFDEIDTRDHDFTDAVEVETTKPVDQRIKEVVSMTDEDVLDTIFDESTMYEILLNSVAKEVHAQTGNQDLFIDQIRCAAHTLQLAINDALKKLNAADVNIINLCRKVSKFLRLPKTQCLLKKMGCYTILPVLDVETRWNSTYFMVNISYFQNLYDRQTFY